MHSDFSIKYTTVELLFAMIVTIKLGTNKSTDWVLARMTMLARSASSK